MSEYLIRAKGIKKHFPIHDGIFSRTVGHVKAVDGVSIDIKKGEIFGLVGESGCGKSTTGRTLINLIEPTAGSVTFEGKVIYDVENKIAVSTKDMQALRRDIQMIFQDPYASLDPRMTVGEIVSEGIVKHKMAKKKEAIKKSMELLELCGLRGSNVNKYPHEFSGGQRQRIGIARALALNPKFIVADEPIAALDVSIQSQVLLLMQELKKKLGLTYLFISHDLGIVKYFCDRIGVMYLGNIVEQGTSEQLFSNPLHPYTKSLLSAVPKTHPREVRERIILKGDVPSPSSHFEGCKFYSRCAYAKEICNREIPELKEIEKDHLVSCHLVGSGGEL
ncbi:ABC transporter ATP-binding protein [Fusibacter sp. 3D3]|uniref:ABC transporter ATP-binding protein n=1 Tax=Fusibacter sp. 3D3 TaxID=1048380 RepID=UPI0008538A44|nr:ABC transporter ATP-binding protein [Fusibacter sp. 3D3]GAU78945.1 oligopeptide transport ATP-binding protein OppF [Fusibacter sp. 3D3]